MLLAEIWHPVGGVVDSAIWLRHGVVLHVREFTQHGPERALALALQLDELAAGDCMGQAISLAIQLGLQGFLFELLLLGGKWVGTVVLAGSRIWSGVDALADQQDSFAG